MEPGLGGFIIFLLRMIVYLDKQLTDEENRLSEEMRLKFLKQFQAASKLINEYMDGMENDNALLKKLTEEFAKKQLEFDKEIEVENKRRRIFDRKHKVIIEWKTKHDRYHELYDKNADLIDRIREGEKGVVLPKDFLEAQRWYKKVWMGAMEDPEWDMDFDPLYEEEMDRFAFDHGMKLKKEELAKEIQERKEQLTQRIEQRLNAPQKTHTIEQNVINPTTDSVLQDYSFGDIVEKYDLAKLLGKEEFLGSMDDIAILDVIRDNEAMFKEMLKEELKNGVPVENAAKKFLEFCLRAREYKIYVQEKEYFDTLINQSIIYRVPDDVFVGAVTSVSDSPFMETKWNNVIPDTLGTHALPPDIKAIESLTFQEVLSQALVLVSSTTIIIFGLVTTFIMLKPVFEHYYYKLHDLYINWVKNKEDKHRMITGKNKEDKHRMITRKNKKD